MAEDKVSRMISAMSAKGLRITEQRKSLARLFADGTGFLTAMEVYQHLETIHDGLSFDTVYRNVRLLLEMEILEQFHFEDGVKFRMGCFEHRHHHHHMICLSCDHIYPLEFCPMDFIEELPKHFEIVKHKFEILGYCRSCIEEGKAQIS